MTDRCPFPLLHVARGVESWERATLATLAVSTAASKHLSLFVGFSKDTMSYHTTAYSLLRLNGQDSGIAFCHGEFNLGIDVGHGQLLQGGADNGHDSRQLVDTQAQVAAVVTDACAVRNHGQMAISCNIHELHRSQIARTYRRACAFYIFQIIGFVYLQHYLLLFSVRNYQDTAQHKNKDTAAQKNDELGYQSSGAHQISSQS